MKILFRIFYICSLFCLILSTKAFSQSNQLPFTAVGRGVATTFVTDYHALGINPANLGFKKSFRDPFITFGVLESNVSIYAEALNRRDLIQSVFNPTSFNFTQEEKVAVADKFANKNIDIKSEVILLGISINLPRTGNINWGGIAFSIRDRIQTRANFNKTISEIMFLGHNAPYFTDLVLSNGRIIKNTPNLPENVREQVTAGIISDDDAQNYGQLLDGSVFSSTWFREYSLGYGTRLVDNYNFSLHAGIGVKLVKGVALIDLAAEGGKLIRQDISMSETFNLSFGDAKQVVNPSFVGLDPGASTFKRALFPKPVATGFGLDLGVNMVIRRNFHLGVSVTNLGRLITWNGNVYQLTDGKLREIQGAGLNTYNVLVSSPNDLAFAGEKSPLQWTGRSSVRKELPSQVRIGGSYEYFKTLHIGFDIIYPINKNVSGNLGSTVYAIGGDYRLSRLFKVSMGFNWGGGTYNDANKNVRHINFPVGVTYQSYRRFIEIGIATSDISSYLVNTASGANLSFAMGFARFRLDFLNTNKEQKVFAKND